MASYIRRRVRRAQEWPSTNVKSTVDGNGPRSSYAPHSKTGRNLCEIECAIRHGKAGKGTEENGRDFSNTSKPGVPKKFCGIEYTIMLTSDGGSMLELGMHRHGQGLNFSDLDPSNRP